MIGHIVRPVVQPRLAPVSLLRSASLLGRPRCGSVLWKTSCGAHMATRHRSTAAALAEEPAEQHSHRRLITTTGKNQRKEYTLGRMDAVLADAKMVAVLQHNSLSVSQFSELRLALNAKGIKVTMFPNSLARKALQGTRLESLNPLFFNSSLLMYSQDADVQALSTIIKKNNKLHLLGVYVDGLTLDMNMLKRYLELPPMDQLYGELLSVINHPPRLLAQLLQRGSQDLVQNLQRYIHDNSTDKDKPDEA